MRTPEIARHGGAKSMPLCALSLFLAAFLAAGCSSSGGSSASSPPPNTGQVNLLLTDQMTNIFPAGVSVLSFEATISSAALNPGGQSLLAAPASVELTRLQTDTALLASPNVATGTYTSLSLTFTGVSITFKNDTGSTLTVGSVSCPTGQTCTASPTVSALSGSLTLPGAGLTITTGSESAMLLDMNLSSALSIALPNTLDANLLGSSAVSLITSGTFATLDDVVGHITAVDTNAGTFTLSTALASYTIDVAGGVSPTIYSNFPTTNCSTSEFSCVAVGQIVSVNMRLLSAGDLLASGVFFEDANTTVPEVEGLVVATTGLTSPAQLEFVVLRETPVVSGLAIGSVIDVAPSTSPAAVFAVDNLGASGGLVDTSNYSFQNASNLMVGQQVQVQWLGTSTNSLIQASRILLRSSRFTANVSNTAAPNFFVNQLPPFWGDAGFTQLEIQTGSTFTQFGGAIVDASQIAISHVISFRAQMFQNGSTPAGVATGAFQY